MFVGGRPGHSASSLRSRLLVESLECREVPATLVVGGSDGSVRTLNPTTGATIATVRPLDLSATSKYNGPVTVALGDINSDSVPDLFVASANPVGVNGLDTSKAGKVFVYDGAAVAKGTLTLIHTYTPFANHMGPGANGTIDRTGAYQNGLNIAVSDVNGDGKLDLIAATRGGTGSSGKVEFGRIIVVNTGTAANGSGDTIIGSDAQGVSPFGMRYAKGIVVAAGNIDGTGGDEIALTRADAVAASNPNKTVKLKAYQFRAATALTELNLGGTVAAFAPYASIGSGSNVIDGGADVTFTDFNNDGKDELVFSALDDVTSSTNTQVRIATFTVDTTSGLATATSTGTGPSKSYLTGTAVKDLALGSIDLAGTGKRTLVLVTESASSGVVYLDPGTGALQTGNFTLTIASGGLSVSGL